MKIEEMKREINQHNNLMASEEEHNIEAIIENEAQSDDELDYHQASRTERSEWPKSNLRSQTKSEKRASP